MSSLKPSRFRKNYLLFPRFQLMLVGSNVATVLVVFGVVWLQMSNAFSELGQAAGLAGVEAEFYRNYLSYQSKHLHLAFGIALAVGLTLCAAISLVISHKFAGPLVRLRNYFRQISEGDLHPVPKLKFRRGDYLGDLPPIINQALERIEEHGQGSEASARSIPSAVEAGATKKVA